MDLATIGFRADTGDLTRAERRLDSLSGTGARTEGAIGKSMKGLVAAFGTVIASVQSLRKILDVTREFDVLNAQLITATGSAENAAVAFAALSDFAAKTPFDLAQSVKGFQQLVNLGLTPSERALTSFGDTASAMGKDLSQMIEAVADASTGEFERLKEFGIKTKKEGDNVSFTFQGVTTSIKNNSAEIEGYLTRLGENNFSGAMITRMDTLDGKISNLGDSFDSLALNISESGVGDAMKTSVETAIFYVNQLDVMVKSGQVSGMMHALSNQWSRAFEDIADNTVSLADSMILSFKDIGISGIEAGDMISEGFKHLPANIRAMIEVATTELWGFVGKTQAIAVAISESFNPFNDITDMEISQRLEEEFRVIDAVISRSYGNIKLTRDSLVESTNREVADLVLLRTNYEESAAAAFKLNEQKDRLAEFKIDPEDVIPNISKVESPLSEWVKDADNFTDGINTSLSAMQGLSKRGSKEYKALGVAMAATNTIQAVGAVLNQGQGDPYTAFGRMAAMAASVAALGMSIGGLSGGFEDQSQAAQDAQGLNIWGDKSESISNSIDMTASATEKLVGINTGMLNALKSVERGISGASALVGRDVVTPEIDRGKLDVFSGSNGGLALDAITTVMFGPIGILADKLLGGIISKTVGKLLGGKSKVVNEGIRIVGGTIGDLIQDVTLQGFQTVKYKKWRFGGSKTKTVFENIGGQAADQMSLVFGSIAESIFAGATALGISAEDATNAINSFNIATIDISLKGLSSDAKQKEIEAVFSRVFDGLASSVIDFLPDFQKVGEGLGETLARVATQVQIADLMTERFGVTFGNKMANPELYAKAADNITTLVGGVEQLAEATSTFTKAFASDAQQLSIQQRELLRSFQAVGLELPSTSQGMWELMQSLDGSTEQGQEQIATLLRLSGASESYIGLLDKVSKRYTNAIEAMFKSSDAVKQIGLDAALAAAKMGDMSLAEALDLGALNPSQSDFGTFADFAFAQAVTANKIQELADLSRGTVSEGQQQIDLLAKIADNTVKEPAASQAAIKVDTADLNAEIKMLRVENAEMAKTQAKLTASMEYTMKRLLTIEQNKEVAE